MFSSADYSQYTVLPVLHYLQDGTLQFKKWVCRMGGETFKRRLVRGVALIIMALNNFVPLLLWNSIPVINLSHPPTIIKSKFKNYF